MIREFFTAVILHGHVTANAIGMHPTDLFALNLVELHGPLGAGELADRTGLSTGATTRLIDRLERSGQVRRVADPADRRRVRIEKVGGHELDAALHAAFEPVGQRMEEVIGRYPADRLEELMRFVAETTAAVQDATREVRTVTGE
ncbi:MarR family transcriptional regulator [Nonomuraea mesophila]|uniref:MarR family transcriptional regulator n=2 Tax=Nonomuraea mesophila TaxID=2530382 RepID=A0A4R5F6B0_9ACTN|nr:MarR family transcriptional regulator [Nonomuraea mesophila]